MYKDALGLKTRQQWSKKSKKKASVWHVWPKMILLHVLLLNAKLYCYLDTGILWKCENFDFFLVCYFKYFLCILDVSIDKDKKMLWQYSSITFVSICCNSIVFCSVHSCTERFVLTFRCTKYTCSSDILIRGGTKILLAVVTS